jgi:hypothetical protein
VLTAAGCLFLLFVFFLLLLLVIVLLLVPDAQKELFVRRRE